MMLRLRRPARWGDSRIEGQYQVARRVPLDVIIEIERPWLWQIYRHPSGMWSRVSVGLVHVSWAWKLPK